MNNDPNFAAIASLRAEIERLKDRVAAIEEHPAVSVPPLRSTDDGCTLCGGPHWESLCLNNR